MSALPQVSSPAPAAGKRTPMLKVADAPLEQSLTWLDHLLGYPGGFLQLYARHPGGEREEIWIPSPTWRGRSDLAHYVTLLESLNADVECSLLRPRRGWGTCKEVPVLHARLEGKKSADLLRNFRPVPTFVIREGSSTRYTAFWALKRPLLRWSDVERANRRLAHALKAPKKFCDPGEFYFAPPGSVLRWNRSRPCPVVVARAGLEFYAPREVVGHLREAPDPNAWRDATGNVDGRRF